MAKDLETRLDDALKIGDRMDAKPIHLFAKPFTGLCGTYCVRGDAGFAHSIEKVTCKRCLLSYARGR